MKRIAIISTYIGQINRGAESFTIELVKKLREKYKIDVYSVGEVETIKDEIIKVSMPHKLIISLVLFLERNAGIYRRLGRRYPVISKSGLEQFLFNRKVYNQYLRNKNYDIMIACCGGIGAHFLTKLRLNKGIPYIYINHGGIGGIEKKALDDKPDCYVTINNQQRRWAEYFYSKVMRIPNGVDCSLFVPNNKHRKKKEKNILVVAALTDFKRIHLAIEAVALLDENVTLTVLGVGELYEELNTLGLEKLGEERFQLKNVSYEKILEYYQIASVFTLPSYDEPFGIVYLEALASGVPVVGPDDEIRKEIIGDAGFTCNVTHIEEYAECLNKALNTEWGDKPRMQALKYDWNVISQKYDAVIQKVINTNIGL